MPRFVLSEARGGGPSVDRAEKAWQHGVYSLSVPLLFKGQQLGKYKIVSPLGSGGFGTVYLAQDEKLVSKPVVIKVLNHLAADNWAVRKFHQEMEALARIERTNPAVNAVIRRCDDQARRVVQAGVTDGPFRGVPFLLKDLYALCTGLLTGLRLKRSSVS